jgi:hypothetical protein
MLILVLVGVLFGTFLGQFFKWYILFPAFGLAAVLVGIWRLDSSPLGSLLQFSVLTISLQLGYFVGLIAPSLLRSAPSPSIEVARIAGESREIIDGATRSIAD